MNTTPFKLSSQTDKSNALLTANASNRELDLISMELCNLSYSDLYPLTAIEYIKRVATRKPSSRVVRIIISIRKHLTPDQWIEALQNYKIHNWYFINSITETCSEQTSFLLECLKVNPRLLLSVISKIECSNIDASSQLLAHLYRYYIKSIEDKNHLGIFAKKCIIILEDLGHRTKPDHRFLCTFTRISEKSPLFKDSHKTHPNFYAEITNISLMKQISNFSDLQCLQHEHHHQQFTDTLVDYWAEQCESLLLNNELSEKRLLSNARVTTNLLLEYIPKTVTPPELLKEISKKLSTPTP